MQDASQKFAKAVSTLSPEDAAIVGSDPGGSRVLEAFIQARALLLLSCRSGE